MSRDYAETRIREALAQSKGNPTKARQQVIAWAIDDHRLLIELAQPHLTGIVAHAVNHVIHNTEVEDEDIPARPLSLNMTPDTFGRQILNALSSGSTAIFGYEGGASRGKKQASQSHIDAIKKMTGGKTMPSRKNDKPTDRF